MLNVEYGYFKGLLKIACVRMYVFSVQVALFFAIIKLVINFSF